MKGAFFSICALLLGFEGVANAASYDEEESEKYEDHSANRPKKVSAGGLAAPGELESGEVESETEKDLERGDQEDSGRGLPWAWGTAELGLASTDISLFSSDSATLRGLGGSGFVLGAGLGARLLYFEVGPKFHYAILPTYERWVLGLDVSFRLPIGRLEPFVGLGLAYTEIPSLRSAANLRCDGVEVRASLGLDVFLSSTFSIGALVTPQLLLLSGAGRSTTGGGLNALLSGTLHY